MEVRLEDRLQHQLERGLDHPVPDGCDRKPALLAAGLGDQPLPHRQRHKPPGLQVGPELGEERLLAPHGRDVVGRLAIYPGRAGALVALDPTPPNQQERRITDEVVEVTEPTCLLVGCPSVQLGLDPSTRAPACSAVGHGASVFTGVLLACQLPGCGLAAALRHAPPLLGRVAGSPDLGLLRRLRPVLRPTADGGPARHRPGRPAGRAVPGRFPRSPSTGRRGRCPAIPRQPRHGYAADLPRGLLAGHLNRRPSRPLTLLEGRALLPGPDPPDFEPVSLLRGFHHWFLQYVHLPVLLAGPGPSGSADPSRRCRGCSHPPLRLQG